MEGLNTWGWVGRVGCLAGPWVFLIGIGLAARVKGGRFFFFFFHTEVLFLNTMFEGAVMYQQHIIATGSIG